MAHSTLTDIYCNIMRPSTPMSCFYNLQKTLAQSKLSRCVWPPSSLLELWGLLVLDAHNHNRNRNLKVGYFTFRLSVSLIWKIEKLWIHMKRNEILPYGSKTFFLVFLTSCLATLSNGLLSLFRFIFPCAIKGISIVTIFSCSKL